MSLNGKTVLVTGAVRRIGRHLAITVARAGGNVILHTSHISETAEQAVKEVKDEGVEAWLLEADFRDPESAARLVEEAWSLSPLFAVVNNSAIFEPIKMADTTLIDWQKHLDINLTAPFLLSQAFAACLGREQPGRIVNLLDWRALRPGKDHFPYTISKAALAAMTQSMALALAPNITVNGLALGAILPPSDGKPTGKIIEPVPAGRWADLDEVGQGMLFLLDGPAYVTGEIIHIDGGRHLV
jgi:NAD(P)-dependent dehydrogenase (short-subunit alcohol dehydrogenase family)